MLILHKVLWVQIPNLMLILLVLLVEVVEVDKVMLLKHPCEQDYRVLIQVVLEEVVVMMDNLLLTLKDLVLVLLAVEQTLGTMVV